ncbi:ParB/RepB/Spo0J family partition protein [Comamonas sp. Y33R10-2]|uniref:ParB/RepB/Spo0J family partition protein n=1 Tax=Comamonas sp. Y33R10-2 TaxID=2853257 RepID=UPI001C5CB9B2|nr:ParB/RepB/Spo0J family partition protein [Comamonas sp. Y33R10-2]QXZ10723.1 ParB/RepB/Spo0J family partition protein [Comamonas sp. Y33R10-2]
MNAVQKSLEARPAPAPEISHPEDVDIPLVSDPVSATVVGSAPTHSSPSHLSSALLLLAAESIDVGTSPNRLEESFDSDEFFLLADSILHNRGNVQPIAVRELAPHEIPSDSPLRYRLISGARRLRACKMHQLPVLAIVQKVQPTRELIDRLVENHLRQPLSPYELGMQLQHILASSQSVSRRELARVVGLDVSVVQKAIDIAALPASVIAAFSSASEIQYRDAKPLKDAVTMARDPVIACAESIKGQEISAKEVIAKLIEAAEAAALAKGLATGVEPFNTPGSPLAIEVDGQALGNVAIDKKGLPQISLALPLNPRQQADLAKLIEKFLRSKVLNPAVRKPAIKKAAAEIMAVTAKQPAANDSQVTGEERA